MAMILAIGRATLMATSIDSFMRFKPFNHAVAYSLRSCHSIRFSRGTNVTTTTVARLTIADLCQAYHESNGEGCAASLSRTLNNVPWNLANVIVRDTRLLA